MKQRLYRYIFCTGYLAVIIATFVPVAGELSKIRIGQVVIHVRLDLMLHLLVYFLICMYYLFGLLKGFKLFENHQFPKFILLVLLLGIVTEFVQLWVPERAFNVLDMISNMAGIGIGVGVIRTAQRLKGITA